MKTIKFKFPSVLMIIILVTFLSSSCSYYRVIAVTDYSSSLIHSYDTSGKYIVLKRGDAAWHMFDVQLKDDSITASLDIYLENNVNHIHPKTEGLNQFRRKEEPEVEYTVHLFTNDTSFGTFDTLITVHESSIYRIDEFEYAKEPSRASVVVPIVLVPMAAIIFFAVATTRAYKSLWYL